MVFPRVAVAIVPAHLYFIPDRAHALGPESHWLSLGQYSSPHRKCIAPMATAGRAENSRRVARGRHFRVAPCSGGIRGMDHRAEECADGFFLFTHTAWVGAVYRRRESATDSAIKSTCEAARDGSNRSWQTQSGIVA